MGFRNTRFSKRIILSSTAILITPTLAFCLNKFDGNNIPIETDKKLYLVDAHDGLENADTPEIKKLAEYEETYGPIVDELMIFSDTPTSIEEVNSLAEDTISKLKEFDEYDLKPLVIFEPVGRDEPLDFYRYREGGYDQFIDMYFELLKSNDITSEMMGTWVIFPEANTPAWQNTTNPEVISDCIVHTASLIRQKFNNLEVSVLLDSKTYPDNDVNWEYGERTSLLPYVENIPKGLIDSFGLQGFPWLSRWEDQTDADQFVDADMAIEAANSLEVGRVWLNTGTFASMHNSNEEEIVFASPGDRKKIFTRIIKQLRKIRDSNFEVSVNAFSADKSNTTEAVDWSYERGVDDQGIFLNFVMRLQKYKIDLSIFDSTEPY